MQNPTMAFRSTSGGLRDCFPLRLYGKAKRLGTWDPAAIDLTRDRADWDRLDELEREAILSLTSLFAAGEEAVTLELLPLVLAIAREGRIEEELYLTTFLFEEESTPSSLRASSTRLRARRPSSSASTCRPTGRSSTRSFRPR